MNTPIGIAWRNGFVRCCSDCFDKPYLISEMKRNASNIMPVVVLSITTKKAKVYKINSAKTDFEIINQPALTMKVEAIADYMINKKNIQKSNKTIKKKQELGRLNELKNYNNKKLTASQKTILAAGLT